MRINIKNHQLALLSTIAIANVMFAAIVRADPNPYLLGDTRTESPNTIKKNTKVKPQQKIQSVNVKKTPLNSKEPWFGEGPVFRESSPFTKSYYDRKMQSLPGAKSAPKSTSSAVEVDRQIRTAKDN